MGVHKSLYVNDDELDVLERAEAYAKRTRRKFSAVVLVALEEYLRRHADEEQ